MAEKAPFRLTSTRPDYQTFRCDCSHRRRPPAGPTLSRKSPPSSACRSSITLHTCRVTARLLSGRTDNDDTRHASAHLTGTLSRRPIPSLGRSWPNRCAKASNAASPRNAPTVPTMTRAQGMTHLAGDSSRTTTTATTASREPSSARPPLAS